MALLLRVVGISKRLREIFFEMKEAKDDSQQRELLVYSKFVERR